MGFLHMMTYFLSDHTSPVSSRSDFTDKKKNEDPELDWYEH